MKFAFLVHPLFADSETLLHLNKGGEFFSPRNLLDLSNQAHVAMLHAMERTSVAQPLEVTDVDHLNDLHSHAGASTEGRLYEVPMSAIEILEEPGRAMVYMEQAIGQAAQWGAEIVGLGSMTGVIGGRGRDLALLGMAAVTTGNSLTVFAALENLDQACREIQRDLLRETVAVVGIPGSIAMATAKMLANRVGRLLLVARRDSRRARAIAAELDCELLLDIPAALAKTRVVVSATSAGGCIDPTQLLPGTIVIDVGVPSDVRGEHRARPDVLVISGGLAQAPRTMSRGSLYLGFHAGIIPSCLAETIVLALEQRAECYSIGRELKPRQIREIGATAKRHGFDFTQLLCSGLPISDSMWATFLKSNTRGVSRPQLGGHSSHDSPTKNGRSGGNGRHKDQATDPQQSRLEEPLRFEAGDAPPPANGQGPVVPHTDNGAAELLASASEILPKSERLAERAMTRHRRFINSAYVALADQGLPIKTFVRGEGCYLWDGEGRKYLDFVAGFGSVNVGHNHPRVVAALQEVLARQAPGFSPAAVNPYAAALAERLVALAPPPLEMVFFCNSGAEAVEAALKLARLATRRSGLLHCHGSFHGKTFGALSVTGNSEYQRPFAPLLPDCESIRYGDYAALERALATNRFAALIVEPIQGEGGMITPPDEFLPAAQQLCRRFGTLLIVDEVQTGLGRTGHMFACDRGGLQPDIMTLAKSLGGGLVPIGAMLARRDLWREAYGTVQSFALHTSTFGGGSTACAVALATLDTIVDEGLAENAAQRGQQLRRGLEEIKSNNGDHIRAIRGDGLMLGVELTPLTPSIVDHLGRDEEIRAMQWLIPKLEGYVDQIPAIYQMQTLIEHYRIYTQQTRSNPLVLRIQPPLTIDASQVDTFLQAFAKTCATGRGVEAALDQTISKSISGQHEGKQPNPPTRQPADG